MIIFCGIFFPTKKKKQASNTPTPLGAVGTTKPMAQDKQKITNKLRTLYSCSKLTIERHMTYPKNFDKTKRVSINKALEGKKEIIFILS